MTTGRTIDTVGQIKVQQPVEVIFNPAFTSQQFLSLKIDLGRNNHEFTSPEENAKVDPVFSTDFVVRYLSSTHRSI
jgi:hypothetical protein